MTEQGEATEEQRPGRVARIFGGPWKWFLGAIGVALAGLVTTFVTGAWSDLDDLRKDVSKQSPLRVVARSRIWNGDTGAMAKALTSGPDRFLLLRGSTQREWDEMFRRNKTAQVGHQILIIVIQGQRNRTVRIVDVRPRILTAGPVLKSTCIYIPTQGTSETFKIKADLDHLRPGYGQKNPLGTFMTKSVDLADGERVTVELSVLAKKHAYEYDLEITYDYGDGADLQTMYVRQPNGDPFRVTGKAKKYTVAYTDPGIASNTYRVVGSNRSC